jgi:hypothetical protein
MVTLLAASHNVAPSIMAPSSVEVRINTVDQLMGIKDKSTCHGRMESRLTSLPPEIIELIAFHCANDLIVAQSSTSISETETADEQINGKEDKERYSAIPSSLRNLLLTNWRMYSLLNTKDNSQLYARIFRSKFDVDPIARRFGPLATSAKNLTKELQKRCILLKRIRRAVSLERLFPECDSEQSRIEMEENLWMAYMMMLENGEWDCEDFACVWTRHSTSSHVISISRWTESLTAEMGSPRKVSVPPSLARNV